MTSCTNGKCKFFVLGAMVAATVTYACYAMITQSAKNNKMSKFMKMANGITDAVGCMFK